ncbi:MAG: hypothetical protein GXO75_00675, partial [Calditrichaeota bacterium]|nr:hypothetical protein [Calditrichota bacterium]
MKRSIFPFACILLIFFSRNILAQDLDLLAAYNGDFENGFTSWRFFEVPNNIGSKAEITTTDVAHGSKAVKITFVPADASVIDRGFDNWDANVPVIGGVKYTAHVTAKANGATELYLSIVFGFFDGSRNVIDQGSEQVLLSNTYQDFTIERTAPAEAATCWIAFRMYDENGARVGGVLYLDNVQLFGQGQTQTVLRPRVMPTQLPSDDVPIAGIDVTEAPFNAKNDGSEDATPAFQSAINYAANAGGAVIFVPSGRYHFDGNLILREKVILRGDWQNHEDGGSGLGTILMPFAGSGAADGTPFLQLERGSGVKNLTIWYPDQSLSDITPYPWTIQCNPNTPNGPGDNTSVINVTLVNSYQGIRVGPAWNELHYIRNVYGAPLKTGIWLSQTTDIGRIMNVHFEP